MPLQATSGAASYDAFGGGVPVIPNYIEEVFSTWLYTGNGSTQTITNGIDLAGKGGMVWVKQRNLGQPNVLVDTVRGANNYLYSNLTNGQESFGGSITATSSGFTLVNDPNGVINANTGTFASWTFREQPKFFDVVTYTGNGVTGRQISHNLGSTPGCVIVKRTDSTGNWMVSHRFNESANLRLNTTAAAGGGWVYGLAPTTFTVWADAASLDSPNTNGGTYVAYLFAHNAGGFGLSGTDNVISCGSYTGNGSSNGPSINLGWPAQFVLVKRTDSSGSWSISDSMRGLSATANAVLFPNNSDAEYSSAGFVGMTETSTGFQILGTDVTLNESGGNYIYIAIRRGPMKVPTTGTSVLGLSARTGTGANATVTGSAGVTDLAIVKNRTSTPNWLWAPRLTGTGYLSSNANTAETAAGTTILQANPWDVMDGIKVGSTSSLTNANSGTFINYLIDRAPGFMDVVCYTGTGANRTVAHSLTAVPELMMVKARTGSNRSWRVYSSALANTEFLVLNATDARATGATVWNSTTPTSSVFTVGTAVEVNASASTYISYLFATCPGVSKVGSYSGNGTSQTIDCGFTSGARFILIKRINTADDWYVWDTARGIVGGNDPVLSPNLSDAERTIFDVVDPQSTGFIVNLNVSVNINAFGSTYIFLAIA